MIRSLFLIVVLGTFIATSGFQTKKTVIHSENQLLKDTTNMVRVEGGSFQMGSWDFDNEQPIHKVTLKDFYIDKYEVTVAQYKAFCKETGASMPKKPVWGWEDNHPIVNVSWNQALAYAEWVGKRLPTEAEWEYAARGAKNATANFIYAGSNSVDVVGWYKRNSRQSPSEVGKKAANSLGIYDMSGNVWEWCHDFYNYYQAGSQENPQGPERGASRIIRGGSWYDNRGTLRTANRHYHIPNFGNNMIGFRLVKDIE